MFLNRTPIPTDPNFMSQAPGTLHTMDTALLSEMATTEIAAELRRCQAERSMLAAEEATLVAELDRRQAHTANGHRSIHELLAGRLDVGPETASTLVALSRIDNPDVWRDLADGEITVDRALAEAALASCGVDDTVRRQSRDWDVEGVRRLAARHRKLTPIDEREAFERRYLNVQPNLDESLWKLDGLLPGLDGKLVSEAVAQRADELPDGSGSRGQRSADALTELVMDGAEAGVGAGEPPQLGATVLIDGDLALATQGQAGAEVLGGPRIGPAFLEEILCGGRVEIDMTGVRLLAVGPAGSAIPPRLRRAVIARDGGRCSAAGCRSRHRLQVHHIVPRSRGGTNDPGNLTTLCWHHHHVVIHGRGFRIDPESPPCRRRFLPPLDRRDRSPPSE